MTEMAIPSGYISDAELIAWVEEKTNAQYDELRGCMDASNQRSDLMKDLSTLKADVDAGKKSAGELIDEIEAIRSKYAGSEYQAEVDALLVPMEVAYAKCLPPDAPQGAFLVVTIMESVLPEDLKNDLTLGLMNQPEIQDNSTLYKQEFSDKLQSEVDQLGRVDGLALINIQELVSDARQTSQLASNLLASRDQAANTLVGNIRG